MWRRTTMLAKERTRYQREIARLSKKRLKLRDKLASVDRRIEEAGNQPKTADLKVQRDMLEQAEQFNHRLIADLEKQLARVEGTIALQNEHGER